MKLFRLDTSIFPTASASSEMADIVEAEWLEAHPDGTVTRRNLGTNPLPSNAWADATVANHVEAAHRTSAQSKALALATVVAEELQNANAVVLAVPLYNFGVSQHVKTWIDLVIAAAGPATPVLKGIPTVLNIVRGGGYGPGTPKEGWDHATPYLRRILADVWEADLSVVEQELTLANTTPAMESLRPLAAELHEKALIDARTAGQALHAKTLVTP